MQSKEEIENDNTYKISVPLIDSTELNNIDNYYEEIVDRFLKSFIKERELVIVQHIMQKQQDKIKQLETDKQKLIEEMLEDKKELMEELKYNFTKREAGLQLKLVDKYLKILKGENDE